MSMRLLVLMGAGLMVPAFAYGAAQAPAPAGAPQADSLPTPADAGPEASRRLFTDEEVRLLQELEVRRIELDRREQALRVRERLVDLAQSRLGERLDAMEKLQVALKELMNNLSTKEEGELDELAKIYANMRPANAATVMNRLEDEIVYDVFTRMKERDSAKIMEKMAPGKARIISRLLAERSELPDF